MIESLRQSTKLDCLAPSERISSDAIFVTLIASVFGVFTMIAVVLWCIAYFRPNWFNDGGYSVGGGIIFLLLVVFLIALLS